MKQSGPVFGRSDVSTLLDIPKWQIASFGNARYPYRIRPTARPAKGQGKKGLYGPADIYKIALAHRMLTVGLEAHVIGEVLRALFRGQEDPLRKCVEQRPKKIEQVRFLVVNFALAPWVKQGKIPKYWRRSEPDQDQWIRLEKWSDLGQAFAVGPIFTALNLRTAFIMPFDELLAEVDARLLGRQFRHDDWFDMSSFPPIPDVPEPSEAEKEAVWDQIHQEEKGAKK
jgi:hypothetical protein